MAKKWIKGAIQRPGALHKALGVPLGKRIPKAKIEAATKRPGRVGRQARLAKTLARLPRPSATARKRGGRKAASTRTKRRGRK